MERQHKAKRPPYEKAVEHDDTTDEAEPDMKKTQSPPGRYAKGGPVMEPKDHDLELMERDDESDLEDEESPSEDEADSEAMSLNEEGPDRHGDDVPDMEDEHSTHRLPYAGGGEIGDSEENIDHEDDYNPAHDEHSPDDSEDQPQPEEDEEHHASITAAIMAKRARMHAEIASGAHDEDMAAEHDDNMMAEGGEILEDDADIHSKGSWDTHEDADQADLSRNADEDANEEDQMSFGALRKENYSESAGLAKMGSPRDSNETGDEEESSSENKRDMISAIRSKMSKKRK
jgi:hypothetical protein